MDRGCRRDSRETGAQTEKRSPGRAPATDIAGGGSLSEDLDTQPGKPKSAATVVASASLGADAHAGHESVACGTLNEGIRLKKALWRPAGRAQLESLELACWSGRRRQDLLDLLDQLTTKIQELTRALEAEVEKRPVARRLMTHPGVGPLTALAFELVI